MRSHVFACGCCVMAGVAVLFLECKMQAVSIGYDPDDHNLYQLK